MQLRQIQTDRDYAYCPNRPRDVERPRSGQRVRVLEVGVSRDVSDEYGRRRRGERCDGVRVQHYQRDGEGEYRITDRTTVVPSRNVVEEWAPYQAALEVAKRQQEVERVARQERERIKRERGAQIKQALIERGFEPRIETWYGRVTLTFDDMEKLLAA